MIAAETPNAKLAQAYHGEKTSSPWFPVFGVSVQRKALPLCLSLWVWRFAPF
jgi:hypothetical protein